MPTNRIRRSRQHSGTLSPFHAQELFFGPDSVLLEGLGFGGLYGNRIAPEILQAEREAAWFRHREELMAAWEARTAHELCSEANASDYQRRERPWAFDQFEGATATSLNGDG